MLGGGSIRGDYRIEAVCSTQSVVSSGCIALTSVDEQMDRAKTAYGQNQHVQHRSSHLLSQHLTHYTCRCTVHPRVRCTYELFFFTAKSPTASREYHISVHLGILCESIPYWWLGNLEVPSLPMAKVTEWCGLVCLMNMMVVSVECCLGGAVLFGILQPVPSPLMTIVEVA